MAKRRTKFILPEKIYNKFQKQVNYLSSNVTNLSSLGLYLNKNVDLSEDQVNNYLKSIREEKTKTTYLYISEHMIDLYKSKVRYLSTFDEFVSANIMYFILTNDFKENDDLISNKAKGLLLSEELVDELTLLSKTLGIDTSLLVDFGLTYLNFDKIPYQSVSQNRIRKFIKINELQIGRMPNSIEEKEQQIAKIIHYIKNV